jgi:glycosyltransferase involved in cell wall biosynthesis
LDDSDATRRLLQQFEEVVLVLGNSPYHEHAYALATEMSATVILHDVVLAHLVAHVEGREGMEAALRRFYPGQASDAIASLHGGTPYYRTPAVAEIPMVEPALQHATSVIVHSEYARWCVEPRTLAPVMALPLPGFAEPVVRPRWPEIISTLDAALVIATVGHVNSNKLHERVIEAMASLEVPGRPIHYVIAGPVEDARRHHLTTLAAQLGLSGAVHMLGAVSDPEVAGLLQRADLMVTLRHPTLEGASASAIEQMGAGRAVVVSDHGSYAELPDDCVIKVDPQVEPAALAEVLRRWLVDSEARAELSDRARAYVQAHHSTARYADRLIEVLTEAHDARPMLDVARRAAAITRTWGQRPGSPLAGRLAGELTALVGGGGSV